MARKTKHPDSTTSKAVVKVGRGRGFVIEHRAEFAPFKVERRFLHHRLVVTAAHCLPDLPPCFGASHYHERTYPDLLGTLDARKPEVWAECLFADPIADIAVLGSPDCQLMYDEAESYGALTNEASTLRIGKAPRKGSAWLLTLDGQWVRCTVGLADNGLWIDNSTKIDGGTSGSPIMTDDRTAIGVVCLGAEPSSPDGTCGNWPNPVLEFHLPGWLLQTRD
jgi:hypothetical protein